MIALVKTIIVLLILAAVTINLTIGENGIFKRAQDATEKWKEASENESKELEKVEGIIDEIASKVSDENPGEMSGEGTEESPYLIQSIEDLVGFSNESMNDNFHDKYISLATDLDFNEDNSYVNPNTTQFGDINCINYGTVKTISDGVNLYKGDIFGKNYGGNINGQNNGNIEVETISNQENLKTYVGGIIGLRNSYPV